MDHPQGDVPEHRKDDYMDYAEKHAELSKLPSSDLAQALLRVVEQSTRHTRTTRLQFEDSPDDITKAYRVDAFPTITPATRLEYRKPGEQAHRLLIGDNMDALMGLSLHEQGTYDLIYIDPPYNTGREDFTYNDRFVSNEDSWRHSKWLSFMEPRLRLARELLKDTGVILVSINNAEYHRLRSLMDSVHGEWNFIDSVVWAGSGARMGKATQGSLDYILVFAKNAESYFAKNGAWRETKPGAKETIEFVQKMREEGKTPQECEKQLKKFVENMPSSVRTYGKVDENYRIYTAINLENSGVAPNLNTPIADPVNNKTWDAPPQGWKYGKEALSKLIAEGTILFRKDAKPLLKVYLDEHIESMVKAHFEAGRALARKRLENILGKNCFTGPKRVDILARWFKIVAPDDAKVLDFFGGSGSTAEAVLHLNNEDQGTRTVTIVTNNEGDDESGKHVADAGSEGIGVKVTRERIVRVMSGEGWHKPEKAYALGGQLAVCFVGSTTEADGWEAHALLWRGISKQPFVTPTVHGVHTFDDGCRPVMLIASTLMFEEPGELDELYRVIDTSDDDARLLCVELAEEVPRFSIASDTAPFAQMKKMPVLRNLCRTRHSVDLEAILNNLINDERTP